VFGIICSQTGHYKHYLSDQDHDWNGHIHVPKPDPEIANTTQYVSILVYSDDRPDSRPLVVYPSITFWFGA
jgi:hypothetical protein